MPKGHTDTAVVTQPPTSLNLISSNTTSQNIATSERSQVHKRKFQKKSSEKKLTRQNDITLEKFKTSNPIVLKQQFDSWELYNENGNITDIETRIVNVSYKILESSENGQLLGKSMEDSSTLMRNCCRSSRSFTSTITDASGDDVIFRVERPYRPSFCGVAVLPGLSLCNVFPGFGLANLCTSHLFPQTMNLLDVNHSKIIEVKQTGSWTNLELEIHNIHSNTKLKLSKNILKIGSTSCCNVFCGEISVQVFDEMRNLVAEIIKEDRGCCTEVYAPCDTIIVKFMDLSDPCEIAGKNINSHAINTTSFNDSCPQANLGTPSNKKDEVFRSSASLRKTSTFIHGSHGSSLCTWDKIGILGAAMLIDVVCWEYDFDQDGLCEECTFTRRNKAMRFAAKNFMRFNSK